MSEAGECSAVCGPGEMKRNVSCVRQEDGQEVGVDERFCSNQIRPAESVPCVVDVCPIGWDVTREVEKKTTNKNKSMTVLSCFKV